MRIFPKFNQSSVCPICGESFDGKAVLIRMPETQKGNICEGKQVHLDCLDFEWLEAGGTVTICQFLSEVHN